jgi:glutamine cyclotransferase
MTENVMEIFQPEEGGLSGLKCIEDKLYALSSIKNCIFVYFKSNTGGYSLKGRIPLGIKNASGVTSDGKTIFIADSQEKTIFCIDPDTEQSRQYLNIRELKGGNADSVINARNSTINDMEILDREMWITFSAGYSSSIFRVEPSSGRILKVISARGPEPKSISLDVTAKCMKVLDSSNKEISDFSFEGEWTGRSTRIPVENPACFSIDKYSKLIISSHSVKAGRKNRGV